MAVSSLTVQLADGLVHRAVAAASQGSGHVGGDIGRRRPDPAGQQRAFYRQAMPAWLRDATAGQLQRPVQGGGHGDLLGAGRGN